MVLEGDVPEAAPKRVTQHRAKRGGRAVKVALDGPAVIAKDASNERAALEEALKPSGDRGRATSAERGTTVVRRTFERGGFQGAGNFDGDGATAMGWGPSLALPRTQNG
jgi:hypothetical protein